MREGSRRLSWGLAERVTSRCKAEREDGAALGRIEAFASVVRATETYLEEAGTCGKPNRHGGEHRSGERGRSEALAVG